ncbi:ISAzo13 family transposase [Acidimicrobiaceae bacterium USS-CC1]|uniref:ISAzo13 family transposase n=1 Tax=Acidiferrimicrobium australe TaxID=2664430 RepID=A0ABW9QWZ5_9ACTN|nr:ISAzo13 family transposase [Acidiferrimicrobium australe]
MDGEGLSTLFARVNPHLDERQRRVLAGSVARALGRGGIVAVAEAAGMSRSTVQAAVAQVDEGMEVSDRVRAPGGGRPRLVERDPTLLSDLDSLVDPETRGDPMCPLRWTTKSTEHLAKALRGMGHTVSADTVGRLLVGMGYSLQAPAKENEGAQHPDRDAQFRYLNGQVEAHLGAGEPVISVDTKKKEVIGNLANKGREYQPKGEPVRVDVHDFPDPKLGKAIPYGVFDIGADAGFVTVGSDADTAAVAVASIGRWWDQVGSAVYPDATRLLITADAGGSNGYRSRLWKRELGSLAQRTGLAITVCHFPPGTSKWNRIEHRLFSHISMNWRGRPLTSHEVVVDLIATTTRSGLTVHAERDPGSYPKGTKVTDAELAAVPRQAHSFHGEWNYTIGGTRLTSRRRKRITTK